ncbi:hypothetical protein QBC45DRAFT_458137 [Copromyces sp. CBS 386.78]|nr:hypothetical protein QBC45DRAFT_458137 [Copromyces sp. CBS 386.78]
MSFPKKQRPEADAPDWKSPSKLSTTFDNYTKVVNHLQPRTPLKRRRCPSPRPSSSRSFSSDTEQELDSETDDEALTITSPQAAEPFSPRQIKPLRRSRPRFQKFTTSSTSFQEEDHRRSHHYIAQTTAHDVRTDARTASSSETPAISTPSASTPTTSAEWCQAQQEDPAVVSLALATRGLLEMHMSMGVHVESVEEGEEDKERHAKGGGEKEEKLERERQKNRKKKMCKKNNGLDKEAVARWLFERVASPGGVDPVPDVGW